VVLNALSSTSVTTLPANTPVTVNAGTANLYKVTLPDGAMGYLDNKAVTAAVPLRKLTLKSKAVMFNTPDSLSAIPIAAVDKGDKVDVLGIYKNYYLVASGNTSGWIALKE
jgi:uncharacterized protein YgiM (DUF1202 family)